MPCAYEEGPYDIARREATKAYDLICFVALRLPGKIPRAKLLSLQEAARRSDVNELTAALCGIISNMTHEEQMAAVYDGTVRNGRKLADWWEMHQEADKRRLDKEMSDARDEGAKAAAIAKLTPHERQLLGL